MAPGTVNRVRLAALLGIAALGTLAACWPSFSTTCRSDGDCPSSYRCDPASASCVASSVEPDDAAAAEAAIGEAGTDRQPGDAPPPDRPTADQTAADSAAGDAGAAEASGSDLSAGDVAGADLAAADRSAGDASVPDRPPSDLPRSDVGGADSTTPDAFAADTAATDVARPDTNRPDTHQPDTVLPDARRPDAFVPDTAQPDTARPDSFVSDANRPDTLQADIGPCTGCTIDNECFGWWDHNPNNPCEWCEPPRDNRWTKINGTSCIDGDSCLCINGVQSSIPCMICTPSCDPLQGVCCGSSGQACCPGFPRCNSGLTCGVSPAICLELGSCGGPGEPCCDGNSCNVWQDVFCCNGFCELPGPCLPDS